jgi:predicted ribosome quality control (RQC) complex YloA/Tae2 family protein
MTIKKSQRGAAPPPPDPENGTYQGRSVARKIVSPDGMVVLVGRTAEDNDVVTFKLGAPRDFWLHVATGPGSHVVVLNPDGLDRLPRATQRLAAALAVRHSKGKAGGRTAVHLTTCGEVAKPRGFPAGKVTIARYATVHAAPDEAEAAAPPLSPLAEPPAKA